MLLTVITLFIVLKAHYASEIKTFSIFRKGSVINLLIVLKAHYASEIKTFSIFRKGKHEFYSI
jgi:hypothetical protein